MVRSILHVACLNILLSPWTHAELYSAITQLEPLLETQKRILDDLDDYITKEDVRLAVLKSYYKIFKEEHEKANKDIANYLGNPLNAYTLIKRLTTDLSNLEDLIKLGKEYTESVTLNHTDVKYPTLDDVSGAAQAIIRLQAMYRLDVHDLAEGRIKGVKHSSPMTAADCFELARMMYRVKDYWNSEAWSMEALRKYREENPPPLAFKEADILEYISFSHYLMGDETTALVWSRKLLELMAMFEEAINKNNKQVNQPEQEDTEDIDDMNFAPEVKQAIVTVSEQFEALCRGERQISSEVAKRLHCRYKTETHPFLRLAPFKVEQLYIDPDVFLFHDVISDSEIEIIKNKTTPKLERAAIVHPRSGQYVPTKNRIGKTAWALDEESPAVACVSLRVADLTGLSVKSAEHLQVVNYGIGGHYAPHFDFYKLDTSTFARLGGHRIATVLFYMSDVEEGGATVFTQLGLSVAPVKGAALFWLNLLPSGEGDYTTFHGSCPVLRGSKWIGTKWIHQVGQELLKPCNLESLEESVRRQRAGISTMYHILWDKFSI